MLILRNATLNYSKLTCLLRGAYQGPPKGGPAAESGALRRSAVLCKKVLLTIVCDTVRVVVRGACAGTSTSAAETSPPRDGARPDHTALRRTALT